MIFLTFLFASRDASVSCSADDRAVDRAKQVEEATEPHSTQTEPITTASDMETISESESVKNKPVIKSEPVTKRELVEIKPDIKFG